VKPLPAKEAKSAGAYVRGPQPAMYQDPKSAVTWSGRGRAPAWLANVKDRSKFLIAGSAEATVAATAGVVSAASKAKAAGKKAALKSVGATAGKGQQKGPQPALYRDPKSGATWSGRGRAPTWLATVKDRSKFLIGGAAAVPSEAGTVSTASKPKVAGKSSVGAKKTAAKKAVAAQSPATKKTVPAVKKVAAKNAARKNAASVKTVAVKVEAPAVPNAQAEMSA
jgi:DNA-binding protein H-NS